MDYYIPLVKHELWAPCQNAKAYLNSMTCSALDIEAFFVVVVAFLWKTTFIF